MTRIAIIGAGRIGLACAKIITQCIPTAELTVVDSVEDACTASKDCGFHTLQTYGSGSLETILREVKPDAVICATPFFVNIEVARIAQKLGSHYIDFTEDVRVTREINALGISRVTFVPQTGLAPGLVSYVGLSLFDQLGKPASLALRVGALPQVSFGPEHYSITWSPEGLINEYINEAERKINGIIEKVPPLSDEETLMVNGVLYEGFTTSGGVGNLDAYEHIPTVEYKTLRHPGHQAFVQKMLSKVDYDLSDGIAAAKAAFTTTRQDVVVLCAIARDVHGRQASRGIHFYPHEALGLTAIELTTAGTGIAVLELIIRGELPAGTLIPSDIPFELLRSTVAYGLIFSAAL